MGYGSHFLMVTSKAEIEKLELSKTSFEKNGAVEGKAHIKNCEADETLMIRQVDNHGRVLVEEVHRVSGSVVAFKLNPRAQLTVLQMVEARLLRGQEVVDMKRQRFTYRDLPPAVEDIPVLMCQPYKGDSYLNINLARQCSTSGFDGWLTWPSVDKKLLWTGAGLMGNMVTCQTISGRGTRAKTTISVDGCCQSPSRKVAHGMARAPCLTDPAYKAAAHEVYADGGNFWRPFSPLFYNLGDECMFAPHGSKDDLCFSDTCIADFRAFVKTEYGTIDRLNAEYAAAYAGFDEVLPVSMEQVRNAPQLIPAWIDHRRHMDSVWAGYLDSARQSIRSQAPDARVGYDGSGETGHGPENGALTATDYVKLGQAMDANIPYYWAFQMDAIRDFSRPGTLFGSGWFGGYPQMWRAGYDPITQRWWLWNGLLRGANVVSIYSGLDDGMFSVIAPDYSFNDYFKPALDEIKKVKSGIGKLLVSCAREDDGTAVFYSSSSMLLCSVSEGMPDFWDSASGTPILMQEALRQYRLVGSSAIGEGALRSGRYHILYLPCSVAMSDREAAQVKEFAKAGGVVLADMRPAIADEHGKPREKGALDELFGVEQMTAKAAMATAQAEFQSGTGLDVGGTMPGLRVDSSLKLAGGKALGKAGTTPVGVVNAYGEGKGILLNMLLTDYLRSPKWSISRFATVEMAQRTGELLRSLLNLAAARAGVSLDHYAPGMRVHRLKTDNIQLVGLVWDAQPFMPGAEVWEPFIEKNAEKAKWLSGAMAKVASRQEAVELRLPGKAHVYDVFRGTYEGYVDAVRREMSPGEVRLLAVLPYEVKSLDVKVSPNACKRGETLAVSAVLQGAITSSVQVFRLVFYGPDGKDVRYYARSQKVADGRMNHAMPLAFNEEPGQWKVKVTDVATGISAVAAFDVTGK